MTWLLAIGLALAAFAVGALACGIVRQAWAAFAAALALGLAGYAMQASPGMPGVPARGGAAPDQIDLAFVDARKEMVADRDRSASGVMFLADAFSRRQRHADAAALLRQMLAKNPRDGEAWLALGNALVEHADGTLTQPALLAYRRADEIMPGAIGPGYFLGLALIRQGRLEEARGVWQSTLENAAEDAAGRAVLQGRLARLDDLLANEGVVPQQDGP